LLEAIIFKSLLCRSKALSQAAQTHTQAKACLNPLLNQPYANAKADCQNTTVNILVLRCILPVSLPPQIRRVAGQPPIAAFLLCAGKFSGK